MATINSIYTSVVSQTLQSASAPASGAVTSSGSGSANDFGAAFTVNISPSSTPVNSNAPSEAAPAPAAPAGGAPAGGGVPVTSSSTSSSEVAALIEEAKSKAAVKIGYTEASNVVDSQGNIESGKLQQIEDQQAAHEAEQKQILNPPTQGQSVNLVA
jgi:hypothetical protein